MAAASASASASSRGLPYKVDAECDIMTILKHRHEIPYHSRPFMWTKDKHIKTVINELLHAWRSNETYWMGIVILYNGDEHPSISDAQHRITLCFLALLALTQLLNDPDVSREVLNSISKYGGGVGLLRPVIPEEDRLLLEKYEWTRLPNIVSCYEEDLEALGNLLNNKDGGEEASSESKLYSAFNDVKLILGEQLTTLDEMASFLRFLFYGEGVKVLRILIPDWRFTIRVFNSFNNIKVEVPASYILKNAFTLILGESRGEEIHDAFCALKSRDRKKEKFEQFIHNVVNIYNSELLTFKDYERTVSTLITPSTDGHCPLSRFMEVAAKLDILTHRINEYPFGNILLNTLSTGCEVMNLCLRPIGIIALKTGDLESLYKVIRLLCAYAIRKETPVSFNRLAFQTGLREIMNPLLSGEISLRDTVSALCSKLQTWLSDIEQYSLIHNLATKSYIGKKDFQLARGMLHYLVLKTDSHEMTLNPDVTHIDHIYPRTPRTSDTPLLAKELCHRLGNLTPLIAENSTSGMKGNCSLGNRPFVDKAPHYAKSNLQITRDVAMLYGKTGVFLDTQITERSMDLARLIARETAIELSTL